MLRLIKRYGGGSRKLYDTEESRYVALEEIGGWIRQGQEVRVVDSKTSEDVTAQTLAQIIYEAERQGGSLLSTEFFHQVIRRGGRALGARVGELQQQLGGLVRTSAKRLAPVRRVRSELDLLREGLAELERSLGQLEGPGRKQAGHRRARQSSGGTAGPSRRRSHLQ